MAAPDQQTALNLATAAKLLDALAARDFARLGSAIAPGGVLEALLPGGFRTCEGPDEVGAAFEGWFGDAHEFEVAEASVATVGSLLHLRWRLSVGHKVVEQNAYARFDGTGCIERLALLCSGFQDRMLPQAR